MLVTGQGDADLPPVDRARRCSPTRLAPIRWGGPFGKVALLADSTSVATDQDAAATAQSLLNLRLKQTRSLTLTAAPNPALEAGDTIRVRFPDGRTETTLIDATTIDIATSRATDHHPHPVRADALELFAGRDAWRAARGKSSVGPA